MHLKHIEKLLRGPSYQSPKKNARMKGEEAKSALAKI